MIGSGINKIRKLRGITQKELANLIGTSNTVIYMYEKNKQTPSNKRITEIAHALNVHPLALMWFSIAVDDVNEHEIGWRNYTVFTLMKPSIDDLIKKTFIYG